MKNIIPSTWLPRPKVLVVGAALTLTAWCGWSIPSLAKPQRNVTTTVNKQRNVTVTANKRRNVTVTANKRRNVTVTANKRRNVTVTANKQRNVIAYKMQALQQSNKRWIQINLKKQQLIAWEGGKPVYAIVISTGKDSTPTNPGTFAIQSKYATVRMKGVDYDVPNVPYTMFYQGGYAIHGAYWHRRFGTPVSHGCTNVAVNHAKWLYNWAPVGTPIVIHR